MQSRMLQADLLQGISNNNVLGLLVSGGNLMKRQVWVPRHVSLQPKMNGTSTNLAVHREKLTSLTATWPNFCHSQDTVLAF